MRRILYCTRQICLQTQCRCCCRILDCMRGRQVLTCLQMQYKGCLIHSISYGVASIRRLLKIIGLVWKRALQKRRYYAKETYNFKEPTNRSHPIRQSRQVLLWSKHVRNALQRSATHCNALQRTAPHCDALHRTATHCNALQPVFSKWNVWKEI